MILDQLAEEARKRVEAKKQICPLKNVKEQALKMPLKKEDTLKNALKQEGISYICEVKRASPSKGLLAESFPYQKIAQEYVLAGAAAISVLTEPKHFLGSDQYLQEIVESVPIPVLRKDFTVDAYQIYEAKWLGTSAILLICAILEKEKLRDYLQLAKELGLSVLTETHEEKEIEMALEAGADIIGVNNRDLRTFEVSLENCLCLRKLVPKDHVFVAESGIRTSKDIEKLRQVGVDGVLIGETLMKSRDKRKMLEELNGGPLLKTNFKKG